MTNESVNLIKLIQKKIMSQNYFTGSFLNLLQLVRSFYEVQFMNLKADNINKIKLKFCLR